MGRSNTIEEQAQKNAAFQKYIDAETANLDKITAQASQNIQTQIQNYYKAGSWDDAKPLLSGSYQHTSTTSEWSLDSVAAMVGTLRASIFGGPTPPGATKSPQDDDLSQAVARMGEMDLLIASSALTVIEGVLQAFASGTQTSVQTQYDAKELVPGMTLFICVVANQFHRSDFLSDETIVQNAYVFDTRFSVKQASDDAKFSEVTSLGNQLDAQAEIATNCDNVLKALAKDPLNPGFAAKAAVLQGIINKANAQSDAIQAEIDKLKVAAKAAAV